MELRQLEYFVAVAEEANFTRAADRVHITQSGVSAQIRQLERELGTPLLDRSARTVTLTRAGVAALGHARAVLAEVQTLRQSVDDVVGVVRGRLTVGMITGCTVTPLFDALAAFRRAHPGVQVSLVEDNSDRLVDGVRAGSTDVALVGVAGELPPGLAGATIVRDRLVAVIARGHPLHGRRRITLAELADHPIVCLPVGTGIRAALDESLAAKGIRATIAMEATAPAAVLDLARRGLGIAVLAASMVADVPAVQIQGATVPALLALVWRASDTDPALRALLAQLGKAFRLAQLR